MERSGSVFVSVRVKSTVRLAEEEAIRRRAGTVLLGDTLLIIEN
jgi:hypothetical protein